MEMRVCDYTNFNHKGKLEAIAADHLGDQRK
jgi:hypothetical protein